VSDHCARAKHLHLTPVSYTLKLELLIIKEYDRMPIFPSHQSIAQSFVEARQTAMLLADYPGEMPTDMAAAYAVQDAAISLFGQKVGGWKVGRINAPLDAHYGANRLVGPIFAHQIVEANGGVPDMPILPGFAAAEAELMVCVAATPPADLTIERAPDFVREVRFGLEMASSPYAGINDGGPAVTASDFGNNHGLVLGPVVADWRERDLMHAPVALSIDGVEQGANSLSNMLDGPFGAFVFLNALLHERGRPLQAGDWISSGAITGVHRIAAGQMAQATFDGEFSVAMRTVAP
jgi:2-keto-4-pentenoate hydratase